MTQASVSATSPLVPSGKHGSIEKKTPKNICLLIFKPSIKATFRKVSQNRAPKNFNGVFKECLTANVSNSNVEKYVTLCHKGVL